MAMIGIAIVKRRHSQVRFVNGLTKNLKSLAGGWSISNNP